MPRLPLLLVEWIGASRVRYSEQEKNAVLIWVKGADRPARVSPYDVGQASYTWRLDAAGYPCRDMRTVDHTGHLEKSTRRIFLARAIAGPASDEIVRYLDGDRFNLLRSNLVVEPDFAPPGFRRGWHGQHHIRPDGRHVKADHLSDSDSSHVSDTADMPL